jgi:adenylylsulfate reductase subunit A
MENRFVPTRFKDGYGPVGAWFLLFKSQATNAFGEVYMQRNKEMLNDYPPYGQAAVPASCLRNHLMLKEMKEGRGPIWMDTVTALANLRETLSPREVKHLEAEAWEDFLDMCIGQCGIWAGENIEPEKKNSELMPTEPYLLGSHSGCCGIWVSGPEDVGAPTEETEAGVPGHLPSGWNWGYRGMTTVKGLFTAGDGVGASGHKFSSGSHAEGRIAAKSAIRFLVNEKPAKANYNAAQIESMRAAVFQPLKTFSDNVGKSTQEDVNPNYILPNMFRMRLQKLMDEYAGGVSAQFMTSEPNLKRALELLVLLREDSAKLGARNLHELMRCWENYHRMYQAESHVRSVLFREETRWPGYYFRSDKPKMDANWSCFVNCRMDPASEEWSMKKVPIKYLFA